MQITKEHIGRYCTTVMTLQTVLVSKPYESYFYPFRIEGIHEDGEIFLRLRDFIFKVNASLITELE